MVCCVVVMLEGRVENCLERGLIASGGCRVERGDLVGQRGAGGMTMNCGNCVAVMQGADGTAGGGPTQWQVREYVVRQPSAIGCDSRECHG